MKLIIKRDQQAMKGMLGGHKGMQFTLSYRLVLTPAQEQLVRHYNLLEYPLTWRNVQGAQVPGETIGSLISGSSVTLSDVTTLVRNEEVIKEACDELPRLFTIVETFGGEETVEYPRS